MIIFLKNNNSYLKPISRFGILGLFVLLFSNCIWIQNIEKDETKFYSNEQTENYQCGIYNSILFIDKSTQEIYPDISYILKYAKQLSLTKIQIANLESKSLECFHSCQVEKLGIQSEEIYLRKNIIRKNIKKDSQKIANEIEQIEALKQKWLGNHFYRYKEAIKTLTKKQKEKLKILLSKEKFSKRYQEFYKESQ